MPLREPKFSIIYYVHIFNVQEMYLLMQSLFKASNHKKNELYCLQVRLLSIIVLLLFQFVCTRYGVEIDIKKLQMELSCSLCI